MINLADGYGRRLKYLRISVTDRCNFRCKYCMPQNTFKFLEHDKLLTYEDILFTANVFSELGVKRVRVTGGEPLVRKGVVEFLADLNANPNIDEVMLTTNGALLSKFAEGLKDAGIKRLNISLDSLKKEKFESVTGAAKFEDTLNGIRTVVKLGFNPVKVNAVVINGFNELELENFCHFASDENVVVRFIEFMPIGNSLHWRKDNLITGDEILKKLEKFEPKLIERDKNSGPAQNYKLNNGATIGIITPISKHFCGECDKLRLTADGKVLPCLLTDAEIDFTDAIKSRDANAMKELIVKSLLSKGLEHHVEGDNNNEFSRTMSKIGG